MRFAPIKKVKVSAQVAGSIRDAIVGGDYQPGDTLPPERDLADQLGVNRSSIREAMLRLEAWGLVEIKHGAGARVANFLSTAGLQLLPFLLAPGGQLDPKWLIDLLELRVLLLGWTASQATLRADPEAILELEQILEEIEAADAVSKVQELDFDFFEKLVELTDNRVLSLVSNAIKKVYLQHRELFSAMYLNGLDTSFHQQTLKAIRKKDATKAGKAMSNYGRSAFERIAT
jgi:fatty acid metabolism transcriptional regulator FadR